MSYKISVTDFIPVVVAVTANEYYSKQKDETKRVDCLIIIIIIMTQFTDFN